LYINPDVTFDYWWQRQLFPKQKMEEVNPNVVFNLQLTVARQEEELSLYHNGTDSKELFELLGEKDEEIERLQAALNDTRSKLMAVAKSSTDVLKECEALTRDKATMVAENEALASKLTTAHERAVRAESEATECHGRVNTMRKDMEERAKALRDAEFASEMAEENVSRLQSRCASLVADKVRQNKKEALTKQAVTSREQVLQQELDMSLRLISQLKEQLIQKQEPPVVAVAPPPNKVLDQSVFDRREPLKSLPTNR
jgi:chromosome segregation ATPase